MWTHLCVALLAARTAHFSPEWLSGDVAQPLRLPGQKQGVGTSAGTAGWRACATNCFQPSAHSVLLAQLAAPGPPRTSARYALLAVQTGDPLSAARRLEGQTVIAANGALETVMLLAQLATPGPPRTEFQARTRARYASQAAHPAVRETASLLERGWTWPDLARFATLLNSAPYFVLPESDELAELTIMLPETRDRNFHLDRLHGYARLVKDFYWDCRVGNFLRETTRAYRQAVRRPLEDPVPAGARVTVSLLAPVDRIEFTRSASAPQLHLVRAGSSDVLPSAEPERGSPRARTARKSRTGSRPRSAPAPGGRQSRN